MIDVTSSGGALVNSTNYGTYLIIGDAVAGYANSTSYGTRWGMPLGDPYPTGFLVYNPLLWTTTYYPNGSNVSINWTSSTSLSGGSINYSIYIYNNSSGSLFTYIGNTSNTNATWENTTNGSINGWFYVVVTACDTVNGLCTNSTSAVFGVYTTTLTVTFGPSALPNNSVTANATFHEYCAYSFYPSNTESMAGANLSFPDGTFAANSTTTTPGASAADMGFGFVSAPGVWLRNCYITNIYGEGNKSVTWVVVMTPAPVPPHTGGYTSTTPSNTIETILILAFLILLTLLASVMSDIKVLGVFACVLMFLLGLWIYTDSIYYQSGVQKINNSYKNMTLNVTGTNTSTGVRYINITSIYTYDRIETPAIQMVGQAGASIGNLLGLGVILLGLYGAITFGMGLYSQPKKRGGYNGGQQQGGYQGRYQGGRQR
jgi:hypothetical protein